VTRVVFDTNTVISALLFGGALSWLVEHWRSGVSVPLVSRATAGEFLRVLHYSKFGLSDVETEVFAARYLPFAERVDVDEGAMVLPECRDPDDRMFLTLAEVGRADVLVTGDGDLLALSGQTRFLVETPEQYRARIV
jgi:putative PIN family toxin of toxin-antitoxin system